MTQQTPDGIVLEVAVADAEDALTAQRWGADRLELNSAMPLGGLTPSLGLLQTVLKQVTIPVCVMIRPRAGGFCYSAAQWGVALREAELALAAGAAGIVVGALDAERDVDQARVAQMVRIAEGREVVFHRAFDLTRSWAEALATLSDLGVTRILSSGQAPTALEGARCLESMFHQSNGQIQIVVGSGVRADVVPPLFAIGARQFHGTFSRPVDDPGYGLGPIRFAENDHLRGLDPAELSRMVAALRGVGAKGPQSGNL